MAIENENTSTQNSFNKQQNNTQSSGIFGPKGDNFQRGSTNDNSQNNGAIWNQNNNQRNFISNSQKNGSWGEGGNISHSLNNSFRNQNKFPPWAQNNNQRNQSNESIGNNGGITHSE